MIKNKNGNYLYFGIFSYARYSKCKFYACFTSGVREVTRYEGSELKYSKMSKEQFYRLPKAKKYEAN